MSLNLVQIDLDALAEVLKSGHLAGAAIDTFPLEPKSKKAEFHCPLQGLKNVILTPTIGIIILSASLYFCLFSINV